MIQNTSFIDKQKFVKFNSDMFRINTFSTKWLSIIGICLGVILVLCGVFISNFFIIGVGFGAFLILFFAFVAFLPNVAKVNASKVFEANASGLPVQRFDYCFDEQELTVKNGSGHVLAKGGYENIEQVIETPTDFYLVADVHSCFGFVVDKNGFTQGDSLILAELLKKNIAKYLEITE